SLFQLIPPSLRSTLFPYTTLFRSVESRSSNNTFNFSISLLILLKMKSLPQCFYFYILFIVKINSNSNICFLYDCICSWISTTRRSEEHTSELQSRENLVCSLLLEK